MECSNCKAPINDGAKFCSNCGSPVVTDIGCPDCNTINSANSKFCKNCGKGLSGTQSVVQNKRMEVQEQEGIKAWIKCKSCGETYYVENKTELQQQNIYYNCSKCGENIDVAFFGACHTCNEHVGFKPLGLTNHVADVGAKFLKGAFIGGVMGYFGLDYEAHARNVASDDTPAPNASGLCPFCEQKHVQCYNCGNVFEVSVAIWASDVYTCPQCKARMNG